MSTELPFDPVTGEVLAAETASNVVEYSVSELSLALKKTLEGAYGHVRVRGELGRVSRPSSGHVYVDLKDDRAVLSGVIWRGVAARLRFQPEQGLEVVVTGRITTFAGQSRYQIVIESLAPAGAGALMALLEERRKKLAAEGLFDAERKKPLPFLPSVIGVVTSPTGSVIRDILHRLGDRFPRRVVVWPVRVQGETCADEVAAAVRGFNGLDPAGAVPRPDLIIVARGGGSLEDLWGFNEEQVVRAVADSAIPVISAIGHETDWTLIDHAADERAPTPTAAAERAVPVRVDLLAQLGDLTARLRRGLAHAIEDRRARTRLAARSLPRLDDLLAFARQRHDNVGERLRMALTATLGARRAEYTRHAMRLSPHLVDRFVATARERLAALCERRRRAAVYAVNMKRQQLSATWNLVSALSHTRVLARGFALVRGDDGAAISSVAETSPGAHAHLEFHDGAVGITFDGAGQAIARRRRTRSVAGEQGSLF